MQQFEEDTVRLLYMMRVVDENGDEINMATLNAPRAQRAPELPAQVPSEPSAPRKIQTSLDDVEKQYHKRKQRDLESARLAGAEASNTVQQVVRGEKVGRNDPCPCGSGKKYKKCHGANE